MSDNKLLHEQTLMLSELLIKITALEQALLTKGLISSVDIATETKKVVNQLTELMKQNMQKEGNNEKE